MLVTKNNERNESFERSETIERSETLEEMGAERPEILVFQKTVEQFYTIGMVCVVHGVCHERHTATK